MKTTTTIVSLNLAKDEALSLAQKTWRDINLLNLENYIEPTRSRAELILHKGDNHKIDFHPLKKIEKACQGPKITYNDIVR